MKERMSMFLYKEEYKSKKMIDLKKIKMIIWDLDDTLWEGTLGEKSIHFKQKRVDLIINLSIELNLFEKQL